MWEGVYSADASAMHSQVTQCPLSRLASPFGFMLHLRGNAGAGLGALLHPLCVWEALLMSTMVLSALHLGQRRPKFWGSIPCIFHSA